MTDGYMFEQFTDEWKRLINQTGLKTRMPDKEGNEQFNCAWDAAAAPDGRLYFPMSSECGWCGTEKLVYYDYESNEVIDCLRGEDVLLPVKKQMPHSKLHTSINFIPRKALWPDAPDDPSDYLVLGVTHCTDGAPQHPGFMLLGFYNHIWEGFPGSQILVYDPKNKTGMTLGTPVPRESIYGAKYDPAHNRLYMIGFIRGHIYCYDLNERRVIKDLGKISDIFTYRLVLGGDGNIYGCTKSGQFFRVNTETVEIEHLDYRTPFDPENYVSRTWYRYIVQGRNHSSGKYMYFVFAAMPDLYRLEYETQKIEKVGSIFPCKAPYKPSSRESGWQIGGFDIDKDGVFWFAVVEWTVNSEMPFRTAAPSYLIRWDVGKGEEPFICGVLGTPERIQEYISEVEYDKVNDILYYVNIATERPWADDRPTVGGIDLKQFRLHYREKGPVSTDDYLDKVMLSEEELLARRRKAERREGEENTPDNPFHAFPPSAVTPVRIWKELPPERVESSAVIGMAFDPVPDGEEGYALTVVTGKKEGPAGSGGKGSLPGNAEYVFTIRNGKVTDLRSMDVVPEEEKRSLALRVIPEMPALPEGASLPSAAGRQFLAVPSCTVRWNGGRIFAGTKDGFAALVSEDGPVFSLGSTGVQGPVKAMVTDRGMTKLFGAAGSEDDLGYLFTYDDRNGLRQLGVLIYNVHGYFDGPTSANVLSALALSPDGRYLAVGNEDRISSVHVIDLLRTKPEDVV